jgi:hypothetical protein
MSEGNYNQDVYGKSIEKIKDMVKNGADGYDFLKKINAIDTGLFSAYQDIDMAFKRAMVENKINMIEDSIQKGNAELANDNPYELAYNINLNLELVQKINDYKEKLEYMNTNPDVNRCVKDLETTEKQLLGDLYEMAVKLNMLKGRETKYDALVKQAGFKTFNDFDDNEVDVDKLDDVKSSPVKETTVVVPDNVSSTAAVSSQSGGRKRSRKLSKASRKRKHSRTPRVIGF